MKGPWRHQALKAVRTFFVVWWWKQGPPGRNVKEADFGLTLETSNTKIYPLPQGKHPLLNFKISLPATSNSQRYLNRAHPQQSPKGAHKSNARKQGSVLQKLLLLPKIICRGGEVHFRVSQSWRRLCLSRARRRCEAKASSDRPCVDVVPRLRFCCGRLFWNKVFHTVRLCPEGCSVHWNPQFSTALGPGKRLPWTCRPSTQVVDPARRCGSSQVPGAETVFLRRARTQALPG